MGKWVLSEKGTPHNIDHFECVMVEVGGRGHQVRAWLRGESDAHVALFSHPARAICEEWLQEFTRRHLQVVPKIFFPRTCPECTGTGRVTRNGHTGLCEDCEGEGTILVDPAEIEELTSPDELEAQSREVV